MNAPKEVRFKFQDGVVSGLWHDEFSACYRSLGVREVGRASSVEWSQAFQQWEVRLPDGEMIGRFDRRDDAIASEIEYLQEEMKRATHPTE